MFYLSSSFFLLFPLLLWLPVILVAASSKFQGADKVSWVLACLVLSWIAYVAFLVVPRRTSPSNR